MREIKFRAWNLLREGWEYFTLNGLLIENNREPKEYKNWCQFTGLKDKNGKEIYEGDIILDKVYKERMVCHWIEKDTRFILGTPKRKLLRCVFPLSIYHNKFEVIGNIYENPELLKEPKTEVSE